jgi:hypothetical protein
MIMQATLTARAAARIITLVQGSPGRGLRERRLEGDAQTL